jgi:hypothetical protein
MTFRVVFASGDAEEAETLAAARNLIRRRDTDAWQDDETFPAVISEDDTSVEVFYGWGELRLLP